MNALNAIETLLQLPANTIVNPPSRNALTNGNGWGTGAGEAWEGFQASSLRNLGGMLNVSVPPINLPIAAYQKILDAFADPAGAVQTLPSFLAGATFSQFLVLNGAGLGVNVGTSGNVTVGPISGGLSGGFSFSTSQLLPTVTRTSALGSTGNITYQASRTRASYSQSLNDGYDESESYAETREGVSNRQVSRDLFQPGTVRERAVGVGVHWREMPLDVLVGSIPLSLNLPATADKVYDNNDEWVRVRFVNGMGDGLKAILPADQPSQCDEFHDAVMDVWFELTEEVLRDDY